MLIAKGPIGINDPLHWAEQENAIAGIRLVQPSVHDMVASNMLSNHHIDPIDHLIIAQANLNKRAA